MQPRIVGAGFSGAGERFQPARLIVLRDQDAANRRQVSGGMSTAPAGIAQPASAFCRQTIRPSGASAWMAPYHDRMPVLLEPEEFDGWLNGSLGAEILKPAAEEKLREHLISPRLNRAGVGDDDPSILHPVAQELGV